MSENRIAGDRRWVGIACVLVSVSCFAVQDTLTKAMTVAYLPALIVALRYAFSVVWTGLLLGPRHGCGIWRTERTALVVFRAVCQGFSSLSMALALQRLPVAEALSIALTAPLAVVFVSGRLLGESVGPLRVLIALSGFAGVLIILRPGGGLEPLGVVYAVTSAVTFMTYLLTSRILARTETAAALSFHTAVWGTFVVGLSFMIVGPLQLPDLRLIGLTMVLGLLSSFGHFALTAAYRFAPASILAPITYIQLVIVGFLGWLVFRHVPDGVTLIGMFIVVVAGVGNGLSRYRSST